MRCNSFVYGFLDGKTCGVILCLVVPVFSLRLLGRGEYPAEDGPSGPSRFRIPSIREMLHRSTPMPAIMGMPPAVLNEEPKRTEGSSDSFPDDPVGNIGQFDAGRFQLIPDLIGQGKVFGFLGCAAGFDLLGDSGVILPDSDTMLNPAEAAAVAAF